MQLKTTFAAALAVAAANAQMMNLTSLIASNSNLSSLLTLLQAEPSITTALANATNITLFAPNNDAIAAYTGNNSALVSSASASGLIGAVLQYHVLSGEYYASNISTTPAFPHTSLTNMSYTNVTGGQVVECRLSGSTVEITSGYKMVSNVTQANLNFTGGVVHVIDQILTIPANFSSTADAAGLTAVLGATEATNLTSVLDTAKDITIFAPSNSAFAAIGSIASGLSVAQAAQILEYHVINGTIAYSSSLKNESVTTLGGKKLNITIEDGNVFVNSAKVINADVLISGGVMHIIDSVLNPNSTGSAPNATASSATAAFSGASSGSAVPFTSGVPAASSTIAALATTESAVASGYSSVIAAGGTASAAAGSSSSKAAAAAAPTGAIGAAALFGAGAFMAANL